MGEQQEAPSGRPRVLRLVGALVLPWLVFLLPAAEEGAPGAMTLLPPLFAISLAFATSRTVLPLLGGVWLGASMIAFREGAGLASPLRAVADTIEVYIVKTSIYDASAGGFQTFNLAVVGFVFLLVGMVAVSIRAGGMAGVAERFVLLAKSARATRMTTWLMGLVIFFDDYANTLIVGGAMRPLADRRRVSREKLAWIVDSTAAPVAGLSILSTWVAFEISQFAPYLGVIGMDESAGYTVFLESLPYRFYCLLTIVFVGAICLSSRDFGPMLWAERRAWRTGAVFRPGARPMAASRSVESEPKEGIPHYAHVALLPIFLTLTSIVTLFWWQGELSHPSHISAGLGLTHVREVLGGVKDNTLLLLVGSLIGLLSALLLVFTRRLLTLVEAVRAVAAGGRTMLVAVAILFLAWAMAEVCGDLGTRDYMASLAPGIPPYALPAGLFILACCVSFATGSSWSTMAILLPIVISLAAQVGEASSIGSTGMVIVSIGAVLDGSIFGDHCSPISDTTILSSVAAGSDHIDHVRTQVPYAVLVMVVAMVAGYFPVASGFPVAGSLAIGVGLVLALVFGLGRPIEQY